VLSEKKLAILNRHAREMALLSTYKYRLGAVLFKGSKVISTGFNSNKTHPGIVKYFTHARVHAEFDCILHADPEAIKGSSMFVLRTTRAGQTTIARPCPLCVQIMREYGIEKVYWTTDDEPFFEASLVEDLYSKIDRKLAFDHNLYPDKVDRLRKRLPESEIFHF
jgi:cytidine deaminase